MESPGAVPAGMTGWREATERALYGPDGFYRRPGRGPGAHFRTSVHASGLFATAIARLADTLGLRAVLDLGSGRGELLRQLAGRGPGLALAGLDIGPRPDDLPAHVAWLERLPDRISGTLVVANEWLDDVPVDVAVRSGSGRRLVLVDPLDGSEAVGARLSDADAAWVERWSPTADRAEIGRPRDEAWADLVGRLDAGAALAVDYGTRPGDRTSGSPELGAGPGDATLAAYRDGVRVPAVPDGSCDITSHVAFAACAAAGRAAGADAELLLRQRDALARLVPAPRLLSATGDAGSYLRSLAARAELAELTARGGLGDFWWLLQSVGVPLPPLGAGPSPAVRGD